MARKQTAVDLIVIVVLLLVAVTLGYRRYYAVPGSIVAQSGVTDAVLAKRIVSLATGWDYGGLPFPDFEAFTDDSGVAAVMAASTLQVAAVMGNNGCNSCQIRELRLLDSLRSQLPASIAIIGLYMAPQVSPQTAYSELQQIRRAVRPSFPLLFTHSAMLEDFTRQSGLPIIFVLRDGAVVSSFKPIPEDDEYSETFYRSIRNRFLGRLRSVNLSDESLSPPGMDISKFRATERGSDSMSIGSIIQGPTVVNFWATWCAPCIEELPSLVRLSHAVGERRSVITFVTENAEDVSVFLRERQLDELPVYGISRELQSLISNGALPTTIIVDRDARIRFLKRGAGLWDSPSVISALSRDDM